MGVVYVWWFVCIVIDVYGVVGVCVLCFVVILFVFVEFVFE